MKNVKRQQPISNERIKEITELLNNNPRNIQIEEVAIELNVPIERVEMLIDILLLHNAGMKPKEIAKELETKAYIIAGHLAHLHIKAIDETGLTHIEKLIIANRMRKHKGELIEDIARTVAEEAGIEEELIINYIKKRIKEGSGKRPKKVEERSPEIHSKPKIKSSKGREEVAFSEPTKPILKQEPIDVTVIEDCKEADEIWNNKIVDAFLQIGYFSRALVEVERIEYSGQLNNVGEEARVQFYKRKQEIERQLTVRDEAILIPIIEKLLSSGENLGGIGIFLKMPYEKMKKFEYMSGKTYSPYSIVKPKGSNKATVTQNLSEKEWLDIIKLHMDYKRLNQAERIIKEVLATTINPVWKEAFETYNRRIMREKGTKENWDEIERVN